MADTPAAVRKATVDGRPVEIFPVLLAFRAVPATFGGGVLALLALVAGSLLRRRREPTKPDSAQPAAGTDPES